MPTLSPEAVDRKLRQAGHPRRDHRARLLRPSCGYSADWGPRGQVLVAWDAGDAGEDAERAALARCAATLRDAGWAVAEGVAGPREFRWPCLVVTANA